jgi:hypothetical protein
MFVAKWQGLYVIAKDAANFFIVSEAQASEYVRTERDKKNKLKWATNAPTIVPTGPGFERPVRGATVSDIRPVEDESRVREVARMMGDAQGTPAGLNHAQELLQQAIDGAAAPTTRAPRKTPSKSKT